MLIERIWAANSLRNFNYLLACPETGEALAIDPLKWELCLELARERGWRITQIFNTHEHHDHTGGNAPLVAATGAQVLAHVNAASSVGGVDRGLRKGDVVRVGRSVELECLDTPGHTFAHICLFAQTEVPALFCGDTLFNAGVGNCHNGGNPRVLYDTVTLQLARLPDHTRIYAGHEYLQRNLEFTLDRESDNEAAAALLARVRGTDPTQAPVTTLAEEKRINTFLRLQSPTVIAGVRASFPELGEDSNPKEIFLKLRALRDRW